MHLKLNVTRQSPEDTAPIYVAVVIFVVWLVTLSFLMLTRQAPWQFSLAALWFIYNVIGWLVPKWRLTILSRRHSTIGLGFTIAGGLIATFGLSTGRSWTQLVLLFFLYAALLYLPFLAVTVSKIKPGRPHWLDLVLAGYVLYLAYRLPLDQVVSPNGAARLGGFTALALTVTLFLGLRLWNRTRWDLSIAKRHVGPTVIVTVITGASFITDYLLGVKEAGRVVTADTLYLGLVIGPLLALLIYGVVQITVRELVKTMGLRLAEAVAAVVSAVLAASMWYGHFSGLSVTGIAVAAGSAWLLQRTKTFAPVGLVHVIGYTLTAFLAQ